MLQNATLSAQIVSYLKTSVLFSLFQANIRYIVVSFVLPNKEITVKITLSKLFVCPYGLWAERKKLLVEKLILPIWEKLLTLIKETHFLCQAKSQ